jgi:hypothetical protein
MVFKLAMTAGVLTVTVLAACTPSTPLTICHATGDPAIPYEAITVTSDDLIDHRTHINDIYPVPVGCCPTKLVEIIDGKITICHATSSKTNPYSEITVSINGLNGHDKHDGDIIPAPGDGCPTTRQ